MASTNANGDPDRCLVIFGNKPMTWTCLDEMKLARHYLHGTVGLPGVAVGRQLCEACLRNLHKAGLSVPVHVTGKNVVPIERIPS